MAKKIIFFALGLMALVLLGCAIKEQIKSEPLYENMTPQPPIKQPVVIEKEKTIENITPEQPKNIMPPFQNFVPKEMKFWVQGALIQPGMTEADFIPIKQHSIKEYGGSFGPYTKEFIEKWGNLIKTKLCAKSTTMKEVAKPHCQQVSTFFDKGYLSFALGLDYDEYIGWTALKNYEAFYTIYLGDKKIGESPHAYIRTTAEN